MIKQRDDGEFLFCGPDLAEAMGLSKSAMRSKYKQLDDDEKTKVSMIWTPETTQKTTFVTESGLYKLVLWSRNSKIKGTACHKFTRWVTHEVLPSIRRTGMYELSELKRENKQLKLEKTGLGDTLDERTAELDDTRTFLTENRYHNLGRDVLQGHIHKNRIFEFLNRHTNALRKELIWIKKTPYVRSGREDVVRDYLVARNSSDS